MSTEVAHNTQGITLAQAMEMPKLRDTDMNQARNEIYKAIARARVMLNDQASKEDLAAEASLVYNELMEIRGGVRLGEISIAIKKGVRGEFGKFYGLSPATFVKWVLAWLESESAQQVKRSAQKVPESHQIEKPKNLSMDEAKQKLNYEYSEWRRGRPLHDYGSVCWKILKQWGELEAYPDESDLYPVAKKEKLAEARNMSSTGLITPDAYRRFKSRINEENSALVRKQARVKILTMLFRRKSVEMKHFTIKGKIKQQKSILKFGYLDKPFLYLTCQTVIITSKIKKDGN